MPRSPGDHPFFARFWLRVSPGMDRDGLAERRKELLARLGGRVIEIGAGNGLNFAFYPPGVTQVVAVEPNPLLRQAGQAAAAQAAVPVEVVNAAAERLPAADAEFDAAVVSLMLCSVRSEQAALSEVRRVIRPGGQLRFLEHVEAATPGLRGLQRVLDATVWPLVGGGCHAARDTAAEITRAGFTIGRLDRFQFPETRLPTHTSPHIIGRAARP